ncbi:MAG TPA: glycosyltransferase [Candidatus Eisenbacteria bacterium]|uniref:Glycosyltransferase n=1 Tax=Eiseniibacteriota bacterium TaxID=2212470 RepID=A0A7V2AUF1_UNCEI|nr:glycosyltransferase [Candidatus Eisenbacteria bacterium]
MDSYRILFLTSSLRTGGAENHLLNLCRYVKSKGHEAAVCTISPREEGLESSLLVEGVALYRIPLSSLAGLPFRGRVAGLKRVVSRFDPDILHAHLFHGEVLAWLASHFTDAPLLATRHSSGLEFGGWRRLAARCMRRRFSALIAVSREAMEEARGSGYGEDEVFLVPNAIDTTRFRPFGEEERARRRSGLLERFFPGASETAPIVGSVGGLRPVKNFPLLVEIAERLGAGGGGTASPRFILFGEGPQREELSRLIERAGLGSTFILAGRSDRLEEIYPLFDIFVLTSRSEGTPLALLEAMACRVACIASDVGGVGEAVGDAGMKVPPGDAEGFSSAVLSLIEQPRMRAELGRRARVRVLERYDTDAWGESILGIYRSALRRQ